mgnify:CR=1 FL=1
MLADGVTLMIDVENAVGNKDSKKKLASKCIKIMLQSYIRFEQF